MQLVTKLLLTCELLHDCGNFSAELRYRNLLLVKLVVCLSLLACFPHKNS